MEASGHARWFERLLSDLQFELWIGDAAEIRTKRVRKQKTDQQDAQLLLRLMMEDRFPRIWVADQRIRRWATRPRWLHWDRAPAFRRAPQAGRPVWLLVCSTLPWRITSPRAVRAVTRLTRLAPWLAPPPRTWCTALVQRLWSSTRPVFAGSARKKTAYCTLIRTQPDRSLAPPAV